MSEIIPAEFCAETIALKKTLESGFFVLGERLSKIKDGQMWESQWDSFSQFLQEMDINEATASRLITVYKTYVEKYKISNEKLIGKSWSNLYELRAILPEKATKKDVEDLIERSSELNQQDIRELIRENKHGECHHVWEELHLRFCTECNKREKI